MTRCLLCQRRDASQKGSHIIPSFFMKRINSIDGCNERNHELGFSIGIDTVEAYFGRDVYEDRRRQYTDDESRIEDRTNLDTKDYVFCSECEKLFSKYESKYCHTYELSFKKDLVENSRVRGCDAALFWYGVIWRISSTLHFNVRLNLDFEEKLRRMILNNDVNGADIYYSLHYCKNYRSNNPTFALFDCTDNVALLIVDEFMLILFNGSDATHNKDVLWGMNFKCDVSKLNNGGKTEKIALFPVQIFKQINDSILFQVVNRIDFHEIFNALHLRLFGRVIPDFIFQEIISEIHKAKLADMYTIKNYVFSMKRVLQAHPNLYRIRIVE